MREKCGRNAAEIRQKCDCRFMRRTWVALISEVILAGMSVSGICFKRKVINMADKDTGWPRTLILRKIVRPRDENFKVRSDNAAVCVAISSGCIRDENGGTKFTHAQYVDIFMYHIRHDRNSTFESGSHFCLILRQKQSNVGRNTEMYGNPDKSGH